MNLLTDPLLRVETPEGLERMTLPGLMAALGQDRVEALTGIQRHQEDAFHVFLCQLGATILARNGDADPVRTEDYWRDGLRRLAGEAGDDAWTLVVEDLSKPAFMQPPLPKGDHGKLKWLGDTPDALDLLPTSKNHDLKQSRAANNESDEWIYALVSLQTMSGYYGRGNPGIARMNSGFGNRPIVEVVHSLQSGTRFCDALTRLMGHRRRCIDGPWGYKEDGIALLWTIEWDGKSSLPLAGLDPNHIEIARRVRLSGNESIIYARAVPSDSSRIDAKALNGLIGDAWLPIDLGQEKKGGKPAEAKALTVSPNGLTADLLRRLLFADRIELSPLQQPIPDREGPVWLSVSVLVRGQGTTDGFHERRIAIPEAQRPRLFGASAPSDPLSDLAKNMIATAGQMQNKVLKPAVFHLLEGAPEKINFDRDSAQAWWESFARSYSQRWSDDYFPFLWQTPKSFDVEDRLDAWRLQLKSHAQAVLHDAFDALPQHSGRRWRARCEAERIFHGSFYNNFPHLKEEPHARAANH